MQKIIQILPLVVIGVAVGMIAVHIVERQKEKAEAKPSITVAEKVAQLPVNSQLSETDRQLAERAFQAPEELDSAIASNSLVSPVPPQRPTMMSEVNVQEPTNRAPAGDDQYFQKDFESLRTDAVKNPDSEQNRATIKKLMEMRQRRLSGE